MGTLHECSGRILWRDVINMVGRVAAAADELRSFAGLVVPPFSTRRILESHWPTAVVTGRSLPDGIEEAVALTDDGPLIIYRRELASCERRFAIAHAIAHLVFDLGSCHRRGIVIERAREIRADEFARELLIPDRALLLRVTMWPREVFTGPDLDAYMDQVDQIASTFHVPPSRIDQRIRELEQYAESPSADRGKTALTT